MILPSYSHEFLEIKVSLISMHDEVNSTSWKLSLEFIISDTKIRIPKTTPSPFSHREVTHYVKRLSSLLLSFQCALESFSEPESSKTEQIDEDDSQDKDSDIGSDTFDDVATGILMEDATDIDEEWSDFESDGNSSGEFDGEINK